MGWLRYELSLTSVDTKLRLGYRLLNVVSDIKEQVAPVSIYQHLLVIHLELYLQWWEGRLSCNLEKKGEQLLYFLLPQFHLRDGKLVRNWGLSS